MIYIINHERNTNKNNSDAIPVRLLSKRLEISSADEEKREACTLLVGIYTVWKMVQRFLKRLRTELSYIWSCNSTSRYLRKENINYNLHPCLLQNRLQQSRYEWDLASYNSIDKYLGLYAKWNNQRKTNIIWSFLHVELVFPGGSLVKNPSANAGDTGLILGSGIYPREEHGNPL